jgi:hypothetical protein
MPDGSPFANLAEFRQLIISHPDPFLRTFTEKLMIYALGRPSEYYDAPALRKVVRDTAASQYRFSDIVVGIVKSPPFQMRRAMDAPATTTAGQH